MGERTFDGYLVLQQGFIGIDFSETPYVGIPSRVRNNILFFFLFNRFNALTIFTMLRFYKSMFTIMPNDLEVDNFLGLLGSCLVVAVRFNLGLEVLLPILKWGTASVLFSCSWKFLNCCIVHVDR